MRFLLETGVLAAAIAAPYFLMDYGWALIVGGVVAAGAVLWPAIANEREDRDLPRVPAKVTLLLTGFLQTVPVVVLGLTAMAITAWLDWAYRIDVVPPQNVRVMWIFTGVLVVVPLLYLALARPIGKGGAANEFLAAVRRKGFLHFREFWLGGAALDFAILCLIAFYLAVQAAGGLLAMLDDGAVPSLWKLVMAFPLLPLGLVASAGLLALARAPARRALSGRAIVRAYVEGAVGKRTRARHTTALACATVLGGWGVTLFVLLHPLHLAVVMANATVEGLEPLSRTIQAVEHWADEQRASGRTGRQMAQVLDAHGHWDAHLPDTGLPALLPGLKDPPPTEAGPAIGNCRLTVAAGATAPTMVPDVEFSEVRETRSELRYCARVACPSPAAWTAAAPVVLFSNQASRNAQWAANLFIDVLANGRATAPGGNCTALGALADRFQG